ncbi:DUF2264 domain-containing protein [Paenibacillus sp. LHD-117]|uniref:DUF2264 domain-containing protein n=1 Tax=Paenibacillus sp. LHD-117 TaxID=3071412 RepID=UPI0027E09E5A|nr:DUF2264 domain-containing protein [Paenibacillus sp. LHD-117]MDQ6422789.1 DUF2264 domain-containing protein [Paenibacillus sp. LHD-117]
MTREQTAGDRAYWLDRMRAVAEPVLVAAAERRLRRDMPVEAKDGLLDDRMKFTHLEAIGRLLCGIAPWLERREGGSDAEEQSLRQRYAELARKAIEAGVDPASPDYLNFTDGHQPIVDAAFLAQALLRAPSELWGKLAPDVQRNIVAGLKATRTRKPFANNWLLFAATIEAFLYVAGEPDWDPMRIDYALRQHEAWYVGDGAYGDGPHFHWDYYNSFVIQPMLLDVLEAVHKQDQTWEQHYPNAIARARRFAAVQERMIAPDGTFPPIGRSLAYRCGAFQSLAQSALRGELLEGLAPGAVRSALTAIIGRTLDAPGTFTEDGWLTIGLSGHQPGLGEGYISTGSTYLCAAVFLPLGLPASDPFWTEPGQPWTSVLAWSGLATPIDSALK